MILGRTVNYRRIRNAVAAHRARAVWTPAALFAQGQQGVWYEPKPEYLYQDAAGTIPVTADGDPVGLMLDRSKGLSQGQPEVIDPQAWDDSSSAWENIEGELIYTATNANRQIIQTGSFPGARYLVSFSVDFFTEENSAPLLNVAIGDSANTSQRADLEGPRGGGATRHYTLALEKYTEQISFNPNRFVSGAPIFNGRIYNISVRELPGNHATQETSAARPIYRTDGTLHWLQFDGVDDVMQAPFSIDGESSNGLAVAIRIATLSSTVVPVSLRNDASFFGVVARTSGFKLTLRARDTGDRDVSLAESQENLDIVSRHNYKSTSLSGFLNGQDIGSTSTTPPLRQSEEVLYLGAQNPGALHSPMRFYGLIDRIETLSGPDGSRVDSYLAKLAGVTL